MPGPVIAPLLKELKEHSTDTEYNAFMLTYSDKPTAKQIRTELQPKLELKEKNAQKAKEIERYTVQVQWWCGVICVVCIIFWLFLFIVKMNIDNRLKQLPDVLTASDMQHNITIVDGDVATKRAQASLDFTCNLLGVLQLATFLLCCKQGWSPLWLGPIIFIIIENVFA